MKEVTDLLKQMSEKHQVPINRIVIGVMQNQLYVWDYDPGRSLSNGYKVLEIIEPIQNQSE